MKFLQELLDRIVPPPSPETETFVQKVKSGGCPNVFQPSTNKPLIFDFYEPNTGRIIIPWGKDLERSYRFDISQNGEVKIVNEGFCPRS